MDALKSARQALIRSPSPSQAELGCGGGRHRVSVCASAGGRAGARGARTSPPEARVGKAGPDPAPCGPGATFPDPAWLGGLEGHVPLQPPFFSWRRGGSWGKKRELGVPPGAGCRSEEAPCATRATSLFGQPGEAGARHLYPGGVGGKGRGAGGIPGRHPHPRPLHSGPQSAASGRPPRPLPQSNPRSQLLTPLGARKPTQVQARASPVPAGSWGRGSTWGLRRCLPPAPI